MNKSIYCCGCQKEVQARLTNGVELYPRRADLAWMPFWRCDTCKNHVGCHHKTDRPTNPLGVIPTPELKNARQHIHRILDPLWKGNPRKRTAIYRQIAYTLGIAEYHTADLRSIDEARKVYRLVRDMASGAVH